MPELPEVETFRRYFAEYGLSKIIAQVEVTDSKVIRNCEPEELAEALRDHAFQRVDRHGKYLFAHLGPSKVVMIHFGMTGNLRYDPQVGPPLAHDRVIFMFTDGAALSYISQRKFGRVELWDSKEACIKSRKLGPDALMVTSDDFHRNITKSTRAIKTVLLDQKRVAGIGNLYADEALFQCQVSPFRPANTLAESETRLLRDKIQIILQTAIDLGACYGQFPANFFIHARDPHGECPRCSTPLSHAQIGQRTTYYCPKCQRAADHP